jgi:hypothetical protein
MRKYEKAAWFESAKVFLINAEYNDKIHHFLEII